MLDIAVTMRDHLADLRERAQGIQDPELQSIALSLVWSMEYAALNERGWPEGFPNMDSRVRPPEEHTFQSATAWVEKMIKVDVSEET